ncbi:MAG: hypothetical protein ORN50_00610 [Crocinitomicaceae bacterium]|nr:hypothetical protein [Crocinitomicaceae bacterium]
MKNNLLNLFLGIFLIGILGSCGDDTKKPVEQKPLPAITCYNVKESKTLIYDNGVVTDSVLFKFTFDAQDRILSQWSIKDELVLDFDYSDSKKITMNQRAKSTGRLVYYTHYILNQKGYASWKNMYANDSAFLNSISFVYNNEGYRTQEYYHVGKDSSMRYYGVWQNECITEYAIPQYETQVVATYTKYPDNRNMGYWPFLRDKSYYLVDTEKYSTRGTSTTYRYTYQFDSLNRPVIVTMLQGSVKLQEKYYTYF